MAHEDRNSVFIIPETSSAEQSLEEVRLMRAGKRKELDFEVVKTLFRFPLKTAERILGVSRQVIKRCCLQNGALTVTATTMSHYYEMSDALGINRWPYRLLQAQDTVRVLLQGVKYEMLEPISASAPAKSDSTTIKTEDILQTIPQPVHVGVSYPIFSPSEIPTCWLPFSTVHWKELLLRNWET